MIKKAVSFIVLVLALMILSGCGTIKGAAAGTAAGMKEDFEAAKEVDSWMRKNLW